MSIPHRTLGSGLIPLGLLLLAVCVGSSARVCAAVSEEAAAAGALQQFTASGGHIAGFGRRTVRVAALDHVLRVDFVGAQDVDPVSDASAEDTVGGAAAGASSLRRVIYPEIWPGVTVAYEPHAGTILKSTYYIQPRDGERPADKIRLRYNQPVRLDAQGNLLIAFAAGVMKESAPVAWQNIHGARRPVEVTYHLLSKHEVGFHLGAYDPEKPLVIDPSLTWSTFLGGSGYDYSCDMALDAGGNVYVVGYSTAAWGAPVRAYTASSDAFVAKLSGAGSIIWSTFLGGSGDDRGYGIALDSGGNAYASGTSTATWGSPVRAYASQNDGFVAKLAGDGSLIWNTFLGGNGSDYTEGVAVDIGGGGDVLLVGRSTATWGSPIRPFTDGLDGFAAKLASDGSLTWNTFLGSSSGSDNGHAIALDASGNAYVSGFSNATWGAPIRAFTPAGAYFDAFVAKLAGSGSLLWNTFLGGSGGDYSEGIAVAASGNVYVSGYSSSSWGSPVRPKSAGYDGFAAKLTSGGALIWHSFLGGSGDDRSYGIAVNASEDLYVTGYGNASWGSPWRAYTADNDSYATKLASDGTLIWNAFFGGGGDDRSEGGVVEDGSGAAHVLGRSNAAWGSPLRAYAAQTDAFVVELSDATTFTISGTVFEDVDFAGIAADWDGGGNDVVMPNVDVELYDSGDVYIMSTITDAGGAFTFSGLGNGNYKVRVRSATLGDADTPPVGGLNATVPATWPYPLPEMTWAAGGALIGGQDHEADDTATADDAGPGDTYGLVTVSGGDVTGVNFGFCYELIVNEDDDGNADSARSKQGTLRQFIKNANAIVGLNRSQFNIPGL